MPQIVRRYQRTKTTRDIICFTENAEEAGQERSYFFAKLVDISKGGAGLETEQPCEAEDQIWLQGIEALSEAVAGEVRWIKRSEDKYNLGLQFAGH